MKNRTNDLHEINKRKEYNRKDQEIYISEIRHLGLGSFRVIKDIDPRIVQTKVEEQFHKWDCQWKKSIELKNQNATLQLAEEKTLQAKSQQDEIDKILLTSLQINHKIDWENLKDNRKFDVPNPKKGLDDVLNSIIKPQGPLIIPIPDEPEEIWFQPNLLIWDKLFKSLAKRKNNRSKNQYQGAIDKWKLRKIEVENENKFNNQKYFQELQEYESLRAVVISKYDEWELEWKKNEYDFYKIQQEHNSKIDFFKSSYFEHYPESIIKYYKLVLNNSSYPKFIIKKFDLNYFKESRTFLIDYLIPAPELFPKLIEVKYFSKKDLKEVYISEKQFAKKFDNAVYNITLRTLHEIFESDQANAIDNLVFNGWVETINKATGKKIKSCIVSIQVLKEKFIEIDLSQVDPKTCFKSFKGIGSSTLCGITAIQPILQINRNDKRFISSYEVANQLNEGSNLASMDWLDFENLIREVFEQEFSTYGGEVKITQSSRDGGVDAIAFDSDPIRGGKTVIQAKRYTNTVGVSAVRDLYGTVVNEGATKGILVTTADYGPDAYEFAKNKPLTLMNGANLLYLLEKHGHKVRIDIAEARKNLQ